MAVFNWGGAATAKDTGTTPTVGTAPKSVGDYILGGLTIVGGVLGGIFGNQQQQSGTYNPQNPYNNGQNTNTGTYAIAAIIVLALGVIYFATKSKTEQ